MKRDRRDNMDNPHKVIYQALKGNEIRLLTLASGPPNTRIQCFLNIVPLGHAGTYDALSYTWGHESSGIGISLNNHSMTVTRNLYEALEALRLPTHARTLWIDALCINQADLKERASQVRVMRQIYEEAQKVMVWLGPHGDNSDSALDLLEKLSSIRHKHFDFAPYGVILMKDLSRAGLPNVSDPAWAALNSLLDRSWFSRVWVIQEVVVSKSSCIRCGGREITWDVVVNGLRAAHEAQLVALLNDYKHVARLQAFRERIAGGSEVPLAVLATSAQNCLATDPRDKIFALMGIANDAKLGGEAVKPFGMPDYEKPEAEVFTEFAIACIDHYGFLDILSSKVFEDAAERLPSWVTDWSKHQTCTPLMIHGNSSGYSASKGSRAECAYSNDRKRLQVWGIITDEVTKIGRALVEPEPDKKMNEADIILEWAKLAQRVGSYPGGTGVDTAFMLTLIANSDNRAQKASEDYLRASISWYKWIHTANAMKIPEYLLSNVNEEEDRVRATLFHVALMRVCYGRRYFLTQKGYMGIGPGHIKMGDLVCIARGASVPLILRENRKFVGGYNLEPLHVSTKTRLVGDSYIHGLMDGEGYNEGCLEEISLI